MYTKLCYLTMEIAEKKTKTKKIKLKINHLILFYKLIERATNYKENILMSLKKCDFFYKNVENEIRLCK